jgi:hypothetical protein
LAHKDNWLGCEHIVLGILRGGDPVAASLLTDHTDAAQLRVEVIALLDKGGKLGAGYKTYRRGQAVGFVLALDRLAVLLKSASVDEAQVLVVMQAKRTVGTATEKPLGWRMRINVQCLGNEMKLSNVEFVA